MRVRLFEMFSGYGGASFAFKYASINFMCVGHSEIDKYAIQCYNQNHKLLDEYDVINYGDARKINVDCLAGFDFLTGGFPCQAFSIAGKGLGERDTRGNLFHEIIRIAKAKRPRYMLLENVKGLTTKTHKPTFDKILLELQQIGYFVKWAVLNAKDYGVPQNRDRVYIACFLDKLDHDQFEFPTKIDLDIFLKDILEPVVDEKYYLTDDQIKKFVIGSNHSNSRVYSIDGCSPCLNTMQGGHRQPFILVKNATTRGCIEGYAFDGISLEHPNSKTKCGRVQRGISATVVCNDLKGVILGDMRIRKLTPKECFRLMGFFQDEINVDGLSNNQQYKLAGNGWVIPVVSKIIKNMLRGSSCE